MGPDETAVTRSSAVVPLRRPNGAALVGRSTIRAARGIAEAIFSRGGAAPPAARLEWLEVELEDFLARGGTRSRRVLSLMVWLVTLLAPLFVGRVGPLGSLTVPDRVLALRALEARFGEPLLAVKALLCLLYYEHPDAAREVGFDGQCFVPRATHPFGVLSFVAEEEER